MKRVVLSVILASAFSVGVANAGTTNAAPAQSTDPFCTITATAREAKKVENVQVIVDGKSMPFLIGKSGGELCIQQQFLLKDPKDAALVSSWLKKHWKGTVDIQFHAIPPVPDHIGMN